eukprot:gnl/TRDRNA2_/TRDRNA2_44044_c0_seq1.p1 gnl/TRDRNA2_/TRDRNA2_44044_c0~~gnl/TRDRNA2_/TRDRNA2_44044_c0_seq1.p1  ORF type:complete len:431 (+),score=86.65 gnl/TRDRNA2_/TRDRNA2_44044_c0_seq1:123-1415(+)
MGTAASGDRLRPSCSYSPCISGGPACASKETYDRWLIEELHKAVGAQDCAKIENVLGHAPGLKDREIVFPNEQTPMTVLGLALNRRDLKVVRTLLAAGISPNMPISEQQRSVYAHRSQLAALNGGDPDLQNLVPTTHFEALCSTQHKELFQLLLEHSANPNSGIIQICYCGDVEMLEALLARSADPNSWQRESTPLVSSVKSKIQPYDKVLSLLRTGADPNFFGDDLGHSSGYPALIIATRKRDYRMVRILLEAGADVNRAVGDEGLPNALFWATYWGELELIKLFVTLSKHRLDLGARKYTNETVFDVVNTSRSFAKMRKPRHIAKLPLPTRPAVVYEKILQLLEDYRSQHPESLAGTALATGSTTAPRTEERRAFSTDRISGSGAALPGDADASSGGGAPRQFAQQQAGGLDMGSTSPTAEPSMPAAG